MGLFNFFKKKPGITVQPLEPVFVQPFNSNLYLMEAFKLRLIEIGYKVDWHTQYLAIIVNDELEIAAVINDIPNSHPSLLQLTVRASHLMYFPGGIQESLMGVGLTFEEQIKSGLDNYINSVFLTIIDSFSESHNPVLDFMVNTNGNDVLWHPKMGRLLSQGKWSEEPQKEPLFECIKHLIPDKLTSNKINWLKIYLSKQKNEIVIGECTFNNQPWDEGLTKLSEYANSWEIEGNFKGIKQFMMFRRCDKYDE